jgi:hypothetical protein
LRLVRASLPTHGAAQHGTARNSTARRARGGLHTVCKEGRGQRPPCRRAVAATEAVSSPVPRLAWRAASLTSQAFVAWRASAAFWAPRAEPFSDAAWRGATFNAAAACCPASVVVSAVRLPSS